MSRRELKEFFEDDFNKHLLNIGNFDLLFERYYSFVQDNQGLGYPLEVGELTQLLLAADVNLFNHLSIYNSDIFNPNYIDLCGAILVVHNIKILDFKALAECNISQVLMPTDTYEDCLRQERELGIIKFLNKHFVSSFEQAEGSTFVRFSLNHMGFDEFDTGKYFSI